MMKSISVLLVVFCGSWLGYPALGGTVGKAQLMGKIKKVSPEMISLETDKGMYEISKQAFPKNTQLAEGSIVTAYLSWEAFQKLKPHR